MNQNLKLSNECNLELMSRYPDNYFEVGLVDPPYGIKETWSKSKTDRFYKKGKLHKYTNSEIPSSEYFKELFRVTKNQIIWGGNYFTDYLEPRNSWIIWDKKHSSKSFMSMAELAWTSYNKATKIARFTWDGARKCEQVDKWHPHQKPIKLYEWVIHNYLNPGDKILDTHLGSMAICIAVENINKKFGWDLSLTGCEIDSEYFKNSLSKINNYNSIQIMKFDETA